MKIKKIKKKYIGQTKNPKDRLRKHLSALRHNHHANRKLQEDWNSSKEENFIFHILEECNDEEMDCKEIYWIKKFNSFTDGYNLTIGGMGTWGYKHSEKEIKKMRQIQKPKCVLQLSTDLTIIQEWESCSQAGKALNLYILAIKKCCERTGYQKTCGGYYWVYKDDYYSKDFNPSYLQVKQKPKKVGQFDLNLNLLHTYESASSAAKSIGVRPSSVSQVCNRKRKTLKGYIFRYLNQYTKNEIEIDKKIDFIHPKVNNSNKKHVFQYSLSGELLEEYSSAKLAEEATGIKKENIQYCCSGHSKTSGGYIWKYC